MGKCCSDTVDSIPVSGRTICGRSSFPEGPGCSCGYVPVLEGQNQFYASPGDKRARIPVDGWCIQFPPSRPQLCSRFYPLPERWPCSASSGNSSRIWPSAVKITGLAALGTIPSSWLTISYHPQPGCTSNPVIGRVRQGVRPPAK